jgi:hypothetical protein
MYYLIRVVRFIYLGIHSGNPRREVPLLSVVPDLFDLDGIASKKFLSFIHCSLIMHSIVSIELDDDCVFAVRPSQERLFFPQSPHLTHVRVALYGFDDCVRLFNQLGRQLHSLSVKMLFVSQSANDILSEITSASNYL